MPCTGPRTGPWTEGYIGLFTFPYGGAGALAVHDASYGGAHWVQELPELRDYLLGVKP